jgi:toxin ParE1/3/4
MTKPLRFDDEAAEELEAAAAWYEARRRNLGIELVTWPLVLHVPTELQVRRYVLRRFPYSIVFVELDEDIRVLAIAHSSREPG